MLVLMIAWVFPPLDQGELPHSAWKVATVAAASLEMAAVALLDFDVVVVLAVSWGPQ